MLINHLNQELVPYFGFSALVEFKCVVTEQQLYCLGILTVRPVWISLVAVRAVTFFKL